MADTKISALTTDSTPDRALDFVPTYDASAVTNKKVALQDVGGYSMQLCAGISLSPADATTYYITPEPAAVFLGAATTHRLIIPRAGVIRKIYINGNCIAGSSETSTISLRLNDTTDTTITSTAVFNAPPFLFSNTALSITVAAGDSVVGKWVTPTWVTNPTTMTMYWVIWVA